MTAAYAREHQSSLEPGTPLPPGVQPIQVELLAVDLETCGRCTGTSEHLAQALALTEPALHALGIDVEVTETVCRTAEEARAARLLASPTLRIDGADIDPAGSESACEASACCDPDGDPIDCRVWSYQGEAHHAAPVGLIVEHLLQAALARSAATPGSSSVVAEPYQLPANLQRFYGEQAATSCCAPVEAATCCEAEEKATCCSAEATAAGGCGCR